MNRLEVHSYLAKSGWLAVVEHDGCLWWTDQFVLAPLERSPVADLLAWWNLPVEVGQYIISGDRVAPETGEPSFRRPAVTSQNLTKILDRSDTTRWTARKIGFNAVYMKAGDSTLAVFDAEGREDPMALDVSKIDVAVGQSTGTGEWWAKSKLSPALWIVNDAIAGAVMPMRCS